MLLVLPISTVHYITVQYREKGRRGAVLYCTVLCRTVLISACYLSCGASETRAEVSVSRFFCALTLSQGTGVATGAGKEARRVQAHGVG